MPTKKSQAARAARAHLTPKEELFVAAYCVRYNGTRAAIEAGYSEKQAATAAYELLRKPHVKAAVRRVIDARKARYAQTADNVRTEVAYVAFSNLQDFYTEDGRLLSPQELPVEVAKALQSIEEGTTSGLRGRRGRKRTRELVVKVKLHDKVGALDLLARLLGIAKGDDLTTPPAGPVFILPAGSEVDIR